MANKSRAETAEIRQQLLDYLAGNPGATLKMISIDLGWSASTTQMRVRRLTTGRVKAQPKGRHNLEKGLDNQWRVRSMLTRYPGINQGEIAVRLNLNIGTVNRHVQTIRREWHVETV
jgi:DNA-binding MarR family transcriptional regulator